MTPLAEPEDVIAYLAEFGLAEPPEGEDLDRLVLRASLDVARVLGGPTPPDPALLTSEQLAALKRGVSAQVEYRLLSGERSFAESEDITAPDVTVLSRWTRVGPKVAEELAGHGLFKRSGTAAPTPAPEP